MQRGEAKIEFYSNINYLKKEFESFNAPINPYKENPKFTPPQSFAYISKVLPGLE